jgi:Flp pilus assembly pilin Flp
MQALIRKLHHDEQGQDILEYTIIVAFAVTLIIVISALYATIKSKLTDANTQLQGIK